MYVFLFAYAIYAHEDKRMALGLLKLKFQEVVSCPT